MLSSLSITQLSLTLLTPSDDPASMVTSLSFEHWRKNLTHISKISKDNTPCVRLSLGTKTSNNETNALLKPAGGFSKFSEAELHKVVLYRSHRNNKPEIASLPLQ